MRAMPLLQACFGCTFPFSAMSSVQNRNRTSIIF